MSNMIRTLGLIYIISSFILALYIFSEIGIATQHDISYDFNSYYSYTDNYITEYNGIAIAAGIGILLQGILVGMSAFCIAHTKDRVDDIYFAVSKNIKSEAEEISK